MCSLKILLQLHIEYFIIIIFKILRSSIGHQVAVKTLHKDAMVHGQKEFLREANIMMGLNHHCIVQLLGVVLKTNMMLVCVFGYVFTVYITH